MNCTKCGSQLVEFARYCHDCGVRIDVVSGQYRSLEGRWKVTTEGDCEGKSVTDLGEHDGFVDEIARKLAHRCYYSLTFHAVRPPKPTKPDVMPDPSRVKAVSVCLDIESGTWDLKPAKHRAEVVGALFKKAGRPVTILEGTYFASFIIAY